MDTRVERTATDIGVAVRCPPSATHPLVAAAGLVAFLATTGSLYWSQLLPGGVPGAALLTICATAAAVFLVDVAMMRVHLRSSTGIDYTRLDPSLARTSLKLLGFAASLGFIAALYWLAPEYHGSFYDRFYDMLGVLVPVWLLLTPIYFYIVDRHMREPHDGYWHLGAALVLRLDEVDRRIIGQHLLGWLVKGFFLPLMFIYFCNGLEKLLAVDLAEMVSFQLWYNLFFELIVFVDVGLAAMGYMMALRVTDTHFRSAEPTMLGWVVAVACYEPFVSLVSAHYLAYSTDFVWGVWLADHTLLYAFWGTAILVLLGIYTWATVMFGARFSNLTHRGIITSGPYRWTRHPAYIAKNLSWWMISIPFLSQGSLAEALRHSLLLLGLNAIYFLRAKTEEWHLSSDPVYQEYSRFIERRGAFRFFKLRQL